MPEFVNMIEKLKVSKHGAICTGADKASLVAGVALAVFLKEEFEVDFRVVYTGDISEVDLVLRQHCDIKDTLSDKRLRISIDYSNTDITTLNWEKNDESGKIYFELDSINRTFENDRVKVEEEGKDTDTIVLVGIENIEYLKSFYTKNKKDIDLATKFVVSNISKTKTYSDEDVVDETSKNLAGLLLQKFVEWKYTPSEKVSAILLYGLQDVLTMSTEIEEDVSGVSLASIEKSNLVNL